MTIRGYWRLNGTPNDSSGNGFNGTWSGTPAYSEGKAGQAGDFDGTNYINAITNVGITTNMTFNALVNVDAIGGVEEIMGVENLGGSSGVPLIRIRETGEIQFVKSQVALIGTSSGFGLTAGKWKMITVDYDGTNFNFYKESILISGGSNSQTFTTTYKQSIGADKGLNVMNGKIDEVIMDNRIWGDAERKNKYAFYNGFI